VSFSRFSTGTKLASKSKKKFKKVSVLDLVPVLRVQKQLKENFQKTVKMYLVPAANLKNKKKFKVGSEYCIRGIPVCPGKKKCILILGFWKCI
jgi:hypothetical protein